MYRQSRIEFSRLDETAEARIASIDAQEGKQSLLGRSLRALRRVGRPARPETAPRPGLFCEKPFRWFEVSRGKDEGDTFLCCPSWLPVSVGNLYRESVQEVWNGAAAQAVRRSILDGSFRYCKASRCPHLNTVTGPVRRIEDVADPDLVAAIRERRVVLPYGPRDVNCSYDRSCNLSCPSCRTEVIVETENAARILGIEDKLRTEALADARLLYITGSGDPFGSPFFRRWLQTMKREEMPKLEVIHLQTNGLLWTPRIWSTIPEDVRALITSTEISIDAASPDSYAVNRRGGRFDRLLRNLEFIGTLRARGPLEWFGINMVVQANNFAEMPDFVRMGKRFGCDTVSFQRLVDWGTLGAERFAESAIHRHDHPRHREFLEVLTDAVFDDPVVFLGNLSEFRRA